MTKIKPYLRMPSTPSDCDHSVRKTFVTCHVLYTGTTNMVHTYIHTYIHVNSKHLQNLFKTAARITFRTSILLKKRHIYIHTYGKYIHFRSD